jgi:hypothetical protein
VTIRTLSQELQAECECCDRSLRFTVMGESLAAMKAATEPTPSMQQTLERSGWLRLPSSSDRNFSKHVCPGCADEITKAVLDRLPKPEGTKP